MVFLFVSLELFNKAKVFNSVSFDKAYDRPKHVPLITVSNHDSCFDDPGIWGIMCIHPYF